MNQKTTSFGVELDQRQEGEDQTIWHAGDRVKRREGRTRVFVQRTHRFILVSWSGVKMAGLNLGRNCSIHMWRAFSLIQTFW